MYMITTAAMASKAETAQIAGNMNIAVVLGSVVEYRAPVIMPIMRALNPDTIEAIHSIQAMIVARALKIGGIFSSFSL
jgi:hypothetical protein